MPLPEIWKSLDKIHGRTYEVSNLGEVRNKKTGRILKQTLNSHGYYHLTLSDRGYSRLFLVHRLVKIIHDRYPKQDEVVDHVDGNKLNNNINNLDWVTRSENAKRAFSLGLNEGLRVAAKINGAIMSKPISQFDMDNNLIGTFESIRSASRKFCIPYTTISKQCTRLTKSNKYPFYFRYEGEI